jgi:serine phosphatase RsbU (regulator of sigma subunit)
LNIPKTPKILVIDDSKLHRGFIKKTLNKMAMQVDECNNGEEGLHLIAANLYHVILLDTIMPVMDGLTFLQKVKSDITIPFIPIILMTGDDDLESKIKGLNLGADDFLHKPINQKELVARVLSLLRLKHTHDLLFKRNMMIKKELEAAKKIQQFIIPSEFSHIAYPHISSYYLPVEDIGGDFFDCYALPGENVGLLMADVTGHGIPAALIVTMSKMIFNIYAPRYTSPRDLLGKVNAELNKFLLDGQYISVFYAIYCHKRKILRFSNAGHCLPLLYKAHTGKVYSLDTDTGFFVGILEETEYESKAVNVESGDKFVMYTDGITELKNKHDEEFGEKRLADFIKSHTDLQGFDFCTRLIEEVINFSFDKTRKDDIALLHIEF